MQHVWYNAASSLNNFGSIGHQEHPSSSWEKWPHECNCEPPKIWRGVAVLLEQERADRWHPAILHSVPEISVRETSALVGTQKCFIERLKDPHSAARGNLGPTHRLTFWARQRAKKTINKMRQDTNTILPSNSMKPLVPANGLKVPRCSRLQS